MVRVSDRIILICMTISKTVFVFVCVYAPQANLSEFEKDRFYQMLQCAVSKMRCRSGNDPELRCARCLGMLGLLMKEKFQRLRLEMKSLKLSQNSANLGTCSLQEVAASWLRSHAANVHGTSSANCFPFSPTAICPF